MLLDWAKIVDCGDAPLTFLVDAARSLSRISVLMLRKDNTVALKQLDKAHEVSAPSISWK